MDHNQVELLVTQPFYRIKEGWLITDKYLNQLIENFDSSIGYSNFVDNYDRKQAEPELYQKAFLQVVTETIFDYPHNAYGEKTFKPISCFRPFILVSVPGALQELRDLGFQTFSSWWSEDYDKIQNPTDRLYAALEIVKWVCSKDIGTLQNMLVQMKPVLTHNYNFYYHKLVPYQTKKFELACKENLKPR